MYSSPDDQRSVSSIVADLAEQFEREALAFHAHKAETGLVTTQALDADPGIILSECIYDITLLKKPLSSLKAVFVIGALPILKDIHHELSNMDESRRITAYRYMGRAMGSSSWASALSGVDPDYKSLIMASYDAHLYMQAINWSLGDQPRAPKILMRQKPTYNEHEGGYHVDRYKSTITTAFHHQGTEVILKKNMTMEEYKALSGQPQAAGYQTMTAQPGDICGMLAEDINGAKRRPANELPVHHSFDCLERFVGAYAQL